MDDNYSLVSKVKSLKLDLTNRAFTLPDGSSINYEQLLDMIQDSSVDSEDLEVIILRPTIACVVQYLRLLDSNCSVLLLPDNIGQSGFGEVCRRFRPRAIWGLKSDLSRLQLPTSKAHQISSEQIFESVIQRDSALSSIPSRQLLLSTSGTTGSSKFVRLSPEAVITNASDIVSALQLSHLDVGITVLPLSYTYGLSVLHSHLIAGARVVLTDLTPLHPSFRALIERGRVTNLPGVPFSFDMYERIGLIHDRPTSLVSFTQAGGPLGGIRVKALAKELGSRGARLSVMYGQTEATARISVLPWSLAEELPSSVGNVVPSGHIEVGSPNDQQEVVYMGPNVMLGYAQCRKDLFAGDVQGGCLETGDLGYIDGGFLYLTGRLKRIAKLHGRRINLDEIEALFPSSCVAALEVGQKIVVFVEEGFSNLASVSSELKAIGLQSRDFRLSNIGTMPRLPNGKINYRELS